jgi:hypothetical protein
MTQTRTTTTVPQVQEIAMAAAATARSMGATHLGLNMAMVNMTLKIVEMEIGLSEFFRHLVRGMRPWGVRPVRQQQLGPLLRHLARGT